MKNFQRQLEKRHGKKNITTQDLWHDDNIQFPRLITELEKIGVFSDDNIMDNLVKLTDLKYIDILDLVDRARNKFDKIKKGI